MITVITNRIEIIKLHKKFHNTLNQHSYEQINCWVGYPGGNFENIVRYFGDLDVWISVQELDSRFWNGFGIGKPIEGANNSLTGEINFPYKDINRRIAGVFGLEDNGNVLVLHRGRIGGGRMGVGKNYFVEKFRGDFVAAIDGNRETYFCLVGELNSPHFPRQVANFIKEIHRVKNINVDEAINDFSDLSDFNYTDEHVGQIVTERNDPVVIERTHGIVVTALARELENRNLEIANDRNRDLFIHRRGVISKLFEIKTNSSTQCLYSAVGQLLIYSIPIQNGVDLIAVLPDKLSNLVETRLLSLGIKLLYFNWNNGEPEFLNLDNIL